MNLPHMDNILHDSAEAYLAQIEADYEKGLSTTKEYHAGLGKTMAYVEAQFALDVLPKDKAIELIGQIEHLLKTS